MIGKTVSHYRIVEKLGEGGMGVVYRAEDTKLKRTVALKFLPSELTRDADAKARFIQEAQAASALDHPNICTIYEIDETAEGQLFICMACHEGETLKERIGLGPLDAKEAVGVALQIARGLAKAHERGIVHRDIKPANTIVTVDRVAKILDFGLAKLVGGARLTRTSSTLGTVAYMSPEQAGGKDVDQRTDIWSLGVVLFEMLTGRLPFKGDYEQAMMYSILNEAPMPLAVLRPDTPKELQNIVAKALAKRPEERYKDMREMIAELEVCDRKLETVNMASGSSKVGRSKRLLLTMLGACVLLAAVIVLGRLHFLAPREKPITSLAVLPFQNLSADPEQEYFSDGMTDALIGELSKIKALRVISRTSVMKFKKTDKSLPRIAHELGVDAVVEGSVLRAGDDVRITAQLINARPEKHLWADNFTRSMQNILMMQSEVAQAIVREIRITVTPEEHSLLTAMRTVNPEAHEAYLKGMFYVNKISPADISRGIGYLERAIEIDSTYALAYAGMGMAYDWLVSFSVLPPREAWPKVRAFATKALALDETLPEAYMLIADTKLTYDWDFKGAEEFFKRALELNPNNSAARFFYSNYLSTQRRFPEAIREAKLGRNLDPLSAIAVTLVASVYLDVLQIDSALVYVNEALAIDSTNAYANRLLSCIFMARGMHKEAIANLNAMISRGDSSVVDLLTLVYADIGETGKARELIDDVEKLSEKHYVAPDRFLWTYCALGDTARIFECLERGYEERSSMMHRLAVQPPMCDFLLRDPRYHALMKKVGLEE
jgi:serine/threonine protein kinase/tetratricopeptide (TPR) repeat protein